MSLELDPLSPIATLRSAPPHGEARWTLAGDSTGIPRQPRQHHSHAIPGEMGPDPQTPPSRLLERSWRPYVEHALEHCRAECDRKANTISEQADEIARMRVALSNIEKWRGSYARAPLVDCLRVTIADMRRAAHEALK